MYLFSQLLGSQNFNLKFINKCGKLPTAASKTLHPDTSIWIARRCFHVKRPDDIDSLRPGRQLQSGRSFSFRPLFNKRSVYFLCPSHSRRLRFTSS
ncbi:hypothetical protein L596_012528 [Steinernema carpocapsae]|uniref:Uncharacterized protein n=1 Tax=Steinernema carpocapsae TaxID=34508 RepID=A0A4V6A4T9_STECR|nr:hypothetical protein L596_012528 [Steinernema carpocapsae]